MGDAADPLLARLVALATVLRTAGVDVSTGELIDAAEALRHLDLVDRRVVRGALRSVLVKREVDLEPFDVAFDRVFGSTDVPAREAELSDGGPLGELARPAADQAARLRQDLERALTSAVSADLDAIAARAVALYDDGHGSERHALHRMLRALDVASLLAAAMRDLRATGEHDQLELALRRHEIARALEQFRRALAAELARRRLGQDGIRALQAGGVDLPAGAADRPILSLSAGEVAELRRVIQPLARQLAARIGRRRRTRSTGRLDVRRTIRRSLQTGGIPIDPVLRRRHPHRPDVVVLCDVSGSVAEFAQFTFALLNAVHDVLGNVRSFAFVGGIAEMTDVFEDAIYDVPVRRVLERTGVVGLDGHSDYGEVFRQFEREHLAQCVGPRTTVIVTGDARSNFREPGVESFAALASRSRRTYWLNPEPRADWGLDDSVAPAYRSVCDGMYEASSVRLLAGAIGELV